MARIKPLPRSHRQSFGRAEINRGEQLSRKKDTIKNVEVGLMDVDSAIMYYFTEVIKPEVEENGEMVKVPIMYANAERWTSIQKRGILRDKKNQLITPLIVFKRTTIARDDTITVDKIDANDPKNFYVFQKKYSKENRYDQFTAKQDLMPTNEMYQVAVPDYVTLSYEAIIWTSYLEQMNKIVERINWSDGSYWGEPNKFKFQSRIESFEDATEMADNERIVKTTFSFTFRGYLIPESFNEYINTKKYLTPQQVVFEGELALGLSSIFQPDSRAQTVRVFGQRSSTLGSLAGATDFIRGVSPGYGNAPQDLEFTNTYGGTTLYIMRGSGNISSSKDDKAVVNLSTGNTLFSYKTEYFSGSQSSSVAIHPAGTPTGSAYTLSPDTNRMIMSGSVDVSLNGLSLLSEATHQKASSSLYDFYLSGSAQDNDLKYVVILHQRSGSQGNFNGPNVEEEDLLLIRYQQQGNY